MLLSVSVIYAQGEATPDARVQAGVMLRLRGAPSLDADILALLEPGTALSLVGRSLDQEWLQVVTPDDQFGWVFAEYLDVYIDLDAAFSGENGYTRLPAETIVHIRQIFADGQARGNRPDVFAKVGDSITVSILSLNPIGDGIYDLGEYGYLQSVIDFYSAAETRNHANSFTDYSLAARIGWTTYGVLDPDESDPSVCNPGEPPLLCEYRVLSPSVALIMFGTNDVGVINAEDYRVNLRRIVRLTEGNGIIPILSTIPMRDGFASRVQEFNRIVSEVASEYAIPLVDYGAAMLPLGMGGLDLDGVHPSVPPKGYKGAADFRPNNLYYGYVIRNLTSLQILDAVWRSIAA
ncbi:MAG: SH3 domain-containing protein [Anaerolineae bacterium]|nr:SH3 domain-containing protein [Anaerolineae bacterium]